MVVGKITAVEPKPVLARLYGHIDAKMEFVVADVEVSEPLLGPKAAKIGRHLRYRWSDVEAWFEQRAAV